MAVSVKLSGTKTTARAVGRKRRHVRVRKKVEGSAARPRLVVNRSTRHVFVQVVDDLAGRTLASASTMEADLRSHEGDKTDKARTVGEPCNRVFRLSMVDFMSAARSGAAVVRQQRDDEHGE